MIPRWVTTLFAGIGAIACIAAAGLLGFFLLTTRDDTIKLESNTPAPDAQYSLALVKTMGGGAAGYCSSNLYVFPSNMPFEAKKDQTAYRVAWLRCSPIRVEWTTARHVSIFASGGDSGIYSIASSDRSGLVRVTYTFGEDEPGRDHGT